MDTVARQQLASVNDEFINNKTTNNPLYQVVIN
jgi:hypothetical protein